MRSPEKKFYCEHCYVEFLIHVEPNYDVKTVNDEFPQSIDWLESVTDCPKCGGKIQE